MAFGASVRSACAAALLVAAAVLTQPADAWTAPIVAKGNKFFNSETGDEFRLKGMAYYPRPNAGEMADVGNYDWAADEHEAVWKPHLEIMKDLGVNTLRLYSVDPGKSHDKFMCACSDAGIYVLVGVTAPCENCSVIDELPPKCYPDSLFTRAQIVYNAFAVYDNTLGFSIGNENNLQVQHGKDGTATAPCVKAFLRDTRAYAASCTGNVRQVPIGLDIADIPPRDQWLKYYDCAVDNDENSRAEWIGFNPYVECDPIDHKTYSQSTGLQTLMKVYDDAAYPRPIMFGEFGCNEGVNTVEGYENQRSFYDAKWMNEEKGMTDEIVGGNVFEFSTEVANLKVSKTLTKTKDPGKFGIGYFSPDTCDHDTVPCVFNKYPEYDNLKTAYTTTKKSAVTMSGYTPSRSTVLTCPSTMSTSLPTTPKVSVLACTTAQPVCNGKKSNAGKKIASKTKVGEKTTVGTVSAANTDSGGSTFNNSAAANSAAVSVSAATGALALSVASVVIGVLTL
ncbi:1,3-beta-glucanosyltransferase [Globisporangium polare]